MNHPRENNSCTVLGGKLYSFTGREYGEPSDIEVLDVANFATSWLLIDLPGMPRLTSPVVCPISDSEIIFMGGYGDCTGTEIYVFDVETAQMR